MMPLRSVPMLAAIAGFLALQWLGQEAAIATYCALALWALGGPLHSLQALSLSWLGSMLNPDIFPAENLQAIATLKWVVLAAAATRTGWAAARGQQPLPRLIVYLGLFAGAASFTSLASSIWPLTSILKLATFFVGATTVVLAYRQLDSTDRIAAWLLALTLVVMLGGALLAASPSGYKHIFRGPSLLKGLLVQPQELAVFLSPLIAWLVGRLVVGEADWRSNCLLLIATWLLLATGSRTGFGASFGAVLACLLMALTFHRQWRRRVVARARRPPVWIAAFLLPVAIVANWDAVVSRATALLYKRASTLAAELETSRGFLVRAQLRNIENSPLLGIGFGMPSHPSQYRPTINNVLGVPVGAPVEKGVLYVAVLEETGIIGTLFFILVLGSIVVHLVTQTSLPYACMALAVLLNNLGEANLFAIGGMGLYYWLVLGFALFAGAPGGPNDRHVAASRRSEYASSS
jgi:hypothetical protein